MTLELALTQLEQAQLYELMTPVFTILLPYYETDKDFKVPTHHSVSLSLPIPCYYRN